MYLFAAWVAQAHALDPGFAVGLQVKGAEPYIAQSGLTGAVELAPGRIASIELGGAFHPDRGREDWTALTTTLVEGYGQGIIVTRERWSAHLVARATPVQGRLAWGWTSVGGHAGFAWVHTVEDIEAGGRTQNNLEDAAAWEEGHPALTAGLSGSARWRLLALRLRADLFTYNENLTSGESRATVSIWLGAEAVVWPSRLHDRPAGRRIEDLELDDLEEVPDQGADTGGRAGRDLGIAPEGGEVEPIDPYAPDEDEAFPEDDGFEEAGPDPGEDGPEEAAPDPGEDGEQEDD